jgi:hypothetical protein
VGATGVHSGVCSTRQAHANNAVDADHCRFATNQFEATSALLAPRVLMTAFADELRDLGDFAAGEGATHRSPQAVVLSGSFWHAQAAEVSMSEEVDGGGDGSGDGVLAQIGGMILVVLILNGLSYAFDCGWMFY